MFPTSTTNQDLINQVERALNKAEQLKEISEALTAYGFGEKQRAELRAALAQAKTASEGQTTAYEKRYRLADTLETSRTALDEILGMHRQLLRVYHQEDEPILRKLGLDKTRNRSLVGWLNQGEQFYGVLRHDAELVDTARRYDLSAEVLDQRLGQLAQIRRTHNDYKQARNKATAATASRNKAIDVLEKRFVEFKITARRALKNRPDLLAALEL